MTWFGLWFCEKFDVSVAASEYRNHLQHHTNRSGFTLMIYISPQMIHQTFNDFKDTHTHTRIHTKRKQTTSGLSPISQSALDKHHRRAIVKPEPAGFLPIGLRLFVEGGEIKGGIQHFPPVSLSLLTRYPFGCCS